MTPLGLTGCAGSHRSTAVAIVGDSTANHVVCDHAKSSSTRTCPDEYTTQPSPVISAALGHSVSVRTHAGQTIDEMLADAQTLIAAQPTVMIESLGANDAIGGNADWQTSFDALTSIVLRVKCPVLTTVPQAVLPVARQINTAIANLAATHPNVRVVDWLAAIRANGQAFSADGIHPTTAAGQAWILDQWKAAEEACHP